MADTQPEKTEAAAPAPAEVPVDTPATTAAADATQQTEPKPTIKDRYTKAASSLKSRTAALKDRAQVQIPDKQQMRENLKHNPVEGLEYVDRDPTNIHKELKVNFKDVIAEPEGVHSFGTVWGTSYKTYSVSKFWCYRLLTMVLGIPFALFWGLYFAFLAFLNVWCVVPFVKCFVIQMKFIAQVWGLLVNTFLDPFFGSIGKMFSSIKLHLTTTTGSK
jgi:caveolin 1